MCRLNITEDNVFVIFPLFSPEHDIVKIIHSTITCFTCQGLSFVACLIIQLVLVKCRTGKTEEQIRQKMNEWSVKKVSQDNGIK